MAGAPLSQLSGVSPGTVQAVVLVPVDMTVSVHMVICRQMSTQELGQGRAQWLPAPRAQPHSPWCGVRENARCGVCVWGVSVEEWVCLGDCL